MRHTKKSSHQMEEVAQAQESGTSNRSVARALRHRRNADDLIFFNITLYHCTFRVMIFERSMILCLVVYNFVLVERNLLLFVIPYIIIIYSLRKEVDIMDYISVKAASEKWGISERRIQKLCEENRIDGTEKFGRAWMIPKDAEKPVDGRMKTRNKQEENHGI